MEQEVTKLYLNDMTRQKMYKLFGLQEVPKIQELEDWLSMEIPLNEEEYTVARFYQNRLLLNISDWNEQELSMGFIGPIINIVNFKIPYKLNFFAQRPISTIVGAYELMGKPDGMVAGGAGEPEAPYFSFNEYKKDINSNGDPAGQNLAAMLAGQSQNENAEIIYGCYVVGRNWYFMALKGKEYAISKDFSATGEEIFVIVKVLKALQNTLFKKLSLEAT